MYTKCQSVFIKGRNRVVDHEVTAVR